MITIGIFGIGASGHTMAYILLAKNYKLVCFNRTLKESIKIIVNDNKIEHPINCYSNNELPSEELDYLIICLKEYHIEKAKPWINKIISTKTKIIIIRNGLLLKEDYVDILDKENILETIIDCPVEKIEDDFYHQLRTPKFILPNNSLSKQFHALIQSYNVEIRITNSFKKEQWKKLIESASLGAILTINNDTCKIFKNNKYKELYANFIEEGIQVAKADGIIFDNNFKDHLLEKLSHYPPEKGSSMLSDFRQGKPLEIQAKNGVISKLAKEYNVSTPLNDWAINLLSNN